MRGGCLVRYSRTVFKPSDLRVPNLSELFPLALWGARSDGVATFCLYPTEQQRGRRDNTIG
jgi:hypothetical protein